jgi:hypothetical protein
MNIFRQKEYFAGCMDSFDNVEPSNYLIECNKILIVLI